MSFLVVIAFYACLLWVALATAASMLEEPLESIFRGRMFTSFGLGVIGAMQGYEEIIRLGWFGAELIAFWFIFALALAGLRAYVIDAYRASRRMKAGAWGPGGPHIRRRDVRHTFPLILAEQKRRRGKTPW